MAITKRILQVGDGEVRVGIGMGFSKSVNDVWIKPSIYVEVPVPLNFSAGTELNDYIEFQLIPYAEELLKDRYTRLKKLAGLKSK